MIIITILTILFFIAGLIIYIRSKESLDDHKGKLIALGISGFGLVLFLVSLVISSVNIVDQTEIGVVKRFGTIEDLVGSGFHIVNPFTKTVDIYDMRTHGQTATFESYSRDAQALTTQVEYQYRINPDSVKMIAAEFGSYELLESKIDNVVESKIKVVLSEYSAMEMLENRGELQVKVAEEVNTMSKDFHITFTSVVIKDMSFSDAFEKSVEDKMIASQEVLKAEQEKQKAIIDAEKRQEVAKIQAEQARITAKGEADAITTKRKALENMPEAYITSLWIDKWDGKLPQVSADTPSILLNPTIQ